MMCGVGSNISLLHKFPRPPASGHVTTLEQDGQMIDLPESQTTGNCVPDYPNIVLSSESGTGLSALRYENAQQAFLSHGQTVWKRALHSWYRGGLSSSLDELSQSNGEVPQWLASMCHTALAGLQKVLMLKESLFPQMGLSKEEILKKYSQISNCSKSPVKALAWHPHVTKLAVGLRDDSVHVYSAGNSLNPILKHKLQKHVTDLAWKPLSGSVLAVACESCILIWHVEPTSLAVRPSSSSVQILQSPSHSPVTSLAWSPHSSHLVSASPSDSSILVWDVPTETCTQVRKWRGAGITHLTYSPDGTKLLTATTAPLFRVWETHHWQYEAWSQLTGRLAASCWSPDGRVLLFAMEGDSGVYAIRYSEAGDSVSTADKSILLADVSQVSVCPDSQGGDVKTGGAIKSIIWDHTGERVAVMFQPDELGNNFLVAVFKATIHPILELLPSGFVKGKAGESAHHIAFQPSFTNGALLSVVWSSGRVGYIPMLFVPLQDLQHRHTQSLRLPFSPLSLNSSSLRSTFSP